MNSATPAVEIMLQLVANLRKATPRVTITRVIYLLLLYRAAAISPVRTPGAGSIYRT